MFCMWSSFQRYPSFGQTRWEQRSKGACYPVGHLNTLQTITVNTCVDLKPRSAGACSSFNHLVHAATGTVYSTGCCMHTGVNYPCRQCHHFHWQHLQHLHHFCQLSVTGIMTSFVDFVIYFHYIISNFAVKSLSSSHCVFCSIWLVICDVLIHCPPLQERSTCMLDHTASCRTSHLLLLSHNVIQSYS